MKKLLFLLMLLPVFCLAQTNTTPQFKRNIPADSLLGYSIPGVTGNHWLPDTAWVKKHVGASGSFLPLTFTSNQTVTQNGFGVLFRAVASGDSSAVVNTPVGFGAATYALSFGTNGFLTTKTTGAAMGANLSGSNRALHINTTGGFYQDSIGHKGIDYGAEIDSTTWGDRTLITRRFFFDHLPSEGDSNLGNSDLTQSDPTRTFTIGTGVLNFIAKNGSDSTAVSVANNSLDAFSTDGTVTAETGQNPGSTDQQSTEISTGNTSFISTNSVSSGGTGFTNSVSNGSDARSITSQVGGGSPPGVIISDGIDHNGLVGDELFTVSGDPNQYVQFGNLPSGGRNTIYSADDSIHNIDRQVSLNQHFLGFLGTTNSDFNVQIHDPVNHIGSEADNIASEIQIQVADTTNNLFSAMEVAPGQAENVTTDNSTQGNFDLESLGDQTTMDMSVTVNSTATKTGIVVATPGGAFEPGIIGKDENYLIGFKYPAGESYATNGKRYNEWIPDWGTVKAGLDSIRSISGTTLYNGDGSTTDSTRTATIIKDLLFNEVDGVTGESATLSIGRTNGIDLATNVPSVSAAEIKVNSQFGESNAQMNYSDNTTGNQKGITISANGLKIIDQIDHIGADANEVFPVSSITQYSQYGKVDSIAIAKADSVGATIGGASVTFHPNAAGDVISTLVTGPTLSPTLIINNNVNLTGNPTTTTQTSGNSSTRIATTAFVAAAVSAVTVPTAANPTASAGTTPVNGSATTFMRSDAAPKVDSAAFTTKALIGTYLTKAQVVATYASLASPTLTGTPTAPTATLGTNTTQLATTAFVLANAGSTTFANPTASIGVTAVNGSATTAMRSDAAPKADTSVLRTVANSYSLSGMQTKLNLKLNISDTTAMLSGVVHLAKNETLTGLKTFNKPLTLTANPSPSYAAGSIVYDSSQSGNSLFTAYGGDSNVSLQIGQEEWLFASNATGSTIPNGTPVYISGSSAGVPQITPAIATVSTSAIAIGITTQSIANGSTGYVTTSGIVHGLDTHLFSIGAVYVGTTAGTLTQTAPVSPNYRYRVGFVTVVDASVGQIQITPSTAAIGNGTAGQILGINLTGSQEFKTVTVNQGLTVSTATNGILQLGMANITPGTINTIHLPANIFQTPVGTAGIDSLVVKIGSTKKLGAIDPNFYATSTNLALKAPIASPTFTGTVTIPNGGVFGTPTSITLTNATGLPNAGLNNSTITLNGSSTALGGSFTVTTANTDTTATGFMPKANTKTLAQLQTAFNLKLNISDTTSMLGNVVHINKNETILGKKTFTLAPVLSSTTASLPLAVDASKNIITSPVTGTGSTIVMSASPTITGTLTVPGVAITSVMNISIPSALNSSATTSTPFLYAGNANNSFRSGFGGSGVNFNVLASGSNYSNVVVGGGGLVTNSSGTHPWLANLVVTPIENITSSGSTLTNVTSLYVAAPAAFGTNRYSIYSEGNISTAGGVALNTAGGELKIAEGTNGTVGQVALVSGTKAITITGITTSSRTFVTLVSATGTSLTTAYQAVCTSNTLTLQANVAAGTINIADGSTLNYWVIN